MTNVHTLSQTMVNLGGSLAHVVKCIQQIVYLFLCAHLLLRIIQLRHAQQIKETDSCEAAHRDRVQRHGDVRQQGQDAVCLTSNHASRGTSHLSDLSSSLW